MVELISLSAVAAVQSVVRLTTRGVISASSRDPKCAVHTRHDDRLNCFTVSCRDGSCKCVVRCVTALCTRDAKIIT